MARSILRPKQRKEPELNITSLVDVVLLLLIFFMLSTTFNRPTKLKIQLPEASVKASNDRLKFIHINIDRNGRYTVDNKLVTTSVPQALKQAMQQTIKGRKEITVQINADAQAPHQAVITVMDVARHLGLLQIAFGAIQTLE
ncbi:hypothetical protein TI03_02610 [Achromatium sp. WMS1]|nr:hypothetical protein TI03_02610 [Achromatium sp. WMS1]